MLIIDASPPQESQPALIPNVQFTSPDLGTNAGSLDNVTNGSGLTPAVPSLTGSHALYATTNAWRSSLHNNSWPRNFVFVLPNIYWVTGISFWPVSGVESSNQVQFFTLQASLDGGTTYAPIAGAPSSFPRGSTTPSNPVSYTWEPVRANQIRFVVTGNYGAGRITWLETQFQGYV